jgi:pimeloyl-[acyl-carrier protein] methyl ester esterase
MLGDFLARAAAPADPALLSPTPFETGLSAIGRQRLSHDLDVLIHTSGLPDGFPRQARVLLVEAGADQIVVREATEALAACLPQADRITLQGAGHCFLGSKVLPMALAWLEPLG